MTKKVIALEDIGLYFRVPEDLNELISGKQIEYIENQVSKKPIRFIKRGDKISVQIGPKVIFDVYVRIDSKSRKYILILDDGRDR